MTHWRDVMTEEEAQELAAAQVAGGFYKDGAKFYARKVERIRNRCTLRIRYKKMQEANNGK